MKSSLAGRGSKIAWIWRVELVLGHRLPVDGVTAVIASSSTIWFATPLACCGGVGAAHLHVIAMRLRAA
jgi:hypothetical protein